MPRTVLEPELNGWQYLVERERAEQQRDWDAEGRPELKPQYVSVPGHEIDVDTLTRQSTVGKIAHAAVDHGWTTKVGESEYVTAERWVNKAVVPGKANTWRWVQAVSPDKLHYISASSLLLLIDGEVVTDKDEILIHLDEYGEHPDVSDSGD